MWPRFISIIVGIWLLASGDVLGLDGTAKANNVICGSLAATFATIALWETTRGLRWLNLLIGIWLVISLLVFGYSGAPLVSSLIGGLLLATFSLIRGEMKEQTGGGWSSLWGRS